MSRAFRRTIFRHLAASVTLTLVLAGAARAATFEIYLDLDNNVATGCPAVGAFGGFEQRLNTVVTESSSQVTAVSFDTCSSGVFINNTPVSPILPPWPIGVGLGGNGTNVIETYLASAQLAIPDPPVVRILAVGSDGGRLVDTVGPVTLVLAQIVEIPTLGRLELILLAALLLGFGLLALRRGGATLLAIVLLLGGATAAWAAVTLDGSPADWSPGDQVATDPVDGPPGADIEAFYAKEDVCGVGATPCLAFRIDAQLVFSQPPTAIPDSATILEDAPATTIDVLANDPDPDGGPKSIVSATDPPAGTVVITNAGADLTYQPDANACGTDTFDYTLNGGSTATVTVNVACVNDAPSFVKGPDVSVPENSGAQAINPWATAISPGPPDESTQTVSFIVSNDNPGLFSVLPAVSPSGALTFTPLPAATGTANITVALQDSGGTGGGGVDTSAPQAFVIAITAVDDPPTAVDDAAAVNEDSGANTIDVLSNDTDPDGGPINITSVTQPANGTVVITNGGSDLTYAPNANYCNNPPGTTLDTFTYTLTPGGSSATVTVTVTCANDDPTAVADAATLAEDSGANTINVLANDTDPEGDPFTITSVTQPANGTVVITNAGADLTYQPNADYCNNPPGTTLDTFTYTLTPGGSTATVTVTVTCVNDDPTAVNDSATVTEDSGANTIDVRSNDTDPDGGANSIQSVTQPANGTVVITNAGADLTYAPNANYCNSVSGVPDTFTYTLTPGGSTATVSVTVTCVDDPPLAVNDAATVNEDSGANTINVQANDTDIDGGTNTIQSVTQPVNGTVVITNGGLDLTYAPNANYCNNPPGTTLDTFTYTLTPGGTSATVTVTVTCLNDGPAIDLDANDDKGTGGSDFALTFTEGDPATLLEDPADATVADVDSANLASLTVTITNLLDLTFETLAANTAGTSITALYTPATGVLALTGSDTLANYQQVLRTVTYLNTDADPDATARVITFVGNDGTSNGNTATATVTIVPVDVAPTAVNDSATVNEDSGANTIDVQANDTDPDGGPISITSVTQPANGTVVITNAGADLIYQPNAEYCNSVAGPVDTFTYTLTPGGSVATVSVTVTCVDDNPTAVNDSATVNEDSGANTVNVLANDTDPDAGPKSITSVTQPANGTVVITNGGADLTYAPNANYCNNPPGTTLDTFTYTLTPGGSVGTVTVTVTCIDDNPVAVADSATVTEDSGANTINVLANDTDVDGGTKLIQSVTQPANGTVVITNGGADLTYAPNANYCNSVSGPVDTFTYTLTPGGSSTTVSVTVTCVDDPPVAVADAATVNEDSGANTVNVLVNDTDPDAGPISITSVTQPANGTVVITNGGADLTYAPNANYCNNPPGTTLDTFTYTLTPGGSSTTVTVTVTCINDPPVADNDAFDFIGNTQLEVDQDTATTPEALETTGTTFGVLDGDSDPVENDAIVVSAIVGCADITAPFDCVIAGVGTVSMQSNGRFSFIPSPGDTDPSESFQYTVTDDGTPPASTTATVTLTRFERVWYVKNDAANGGLGRSHDPFDTLAEAQTASVAGDWIFVYFGNGTDTGQAAGITLKASQHLLGEHVGLSIPVNLNGNGSPTNLVAAAAGNRPLIHHNGVGNNGISITNAIPVEIRGLSLGSNNANAIDLTSAAALTGSGTLTISDNVIRTAGAEGVDINFNAGTTGTLGMSFTNNTWNLAGPHTGNAFDVNRAAGTLNLAFSNNTGIVSAATAVNIVGGAAANMFITGFANNTVHQDTGGTGIAISNATFDATPAGVYQQVTGGNTVIGTPGDGVGGGGISWSGVSGDLAFVDLDIFASGGGAFVLTGTGAVNTGAGSGTRVTVGAGVAVFQATGGAAVDVNNATIDLQLSSLTSTNTATRGVSLVNVSDGTSNAVFSAPSGSAITTTAGATGPIFNVSGGNAAITYGGTITNNGTAARAVSVTTWAGDDAADDILFSGAIDENGAGILLNANAGTRAITFSGGLDIDTTTGEGFAATSNTNTLGLHITGTTNDIASISATALRVTSTTIGNSNLNFRNISSGNNTAAADPANGIVLNVTGSTGSLFVTGTGAAGSGGVIQNTTGDAISLTSTQSPSFTSVNVTNTGGQGINANNLTAGFTLSSCQVTNTGDGDNEHAVKMLDISGTVSVQGSTFSNTAEDFFNIDSSANNNQLIMNVGTTTACTLTQPNTLAGIRAGGAFAGNGILITQRSTKNYTLNVSNSTFTDIKGAGFQLGSSASTSTAANVNVNLDNNDFLVTITNSLGNPNNRANLINIQALNTLDVDASITNNLLDGGGGGGIQLGADNNANINANITGNVVSDQFADGILIGVDEGGDMVLLIDNNQISNTSSDGMEIANAIFSDGLTATLNATITNNVVNGHNNNAGSNAFFAGIAVFGGADASDVTFVNVTGNSVSGNPNPLVFFDYALDGSSFGDLITLQGPGAAAVAEADFLAAPPPQNTTTAPVGGRTFIGNTFYSNGATVPLPVLTP